MRWFLVEGLLILYGGLVGLVLGLSGEVVEGDGQQAIEIQVKRCCPRQIGSCAQDYGEGDLLFSTNSPEEEAITLKFKTVEDEIRLPSYLLPQRYENVTVNLRIGDSPSGSFKCRSKSGNTSFTLSLLEGETEEEFMKVLQFLPYNGYFKYGANNFDPRDYCVQKLEGKDSMEVITCNPECSLSRPCVTKCCDLNQVWDVSKYPHVKCADAGRDNDNNNSSLGHLWNPRVFARAPDSVPLDSSDYVPHFITHHPRIWVTGAFNIESLRDIPPDKRALFKTLPDGSVWKKMNQIEWKPLPKGNFCIDGARNFPESSGGGFSGDYKDTIILFCGDCLNPGDSEDNYCTVHASPYLYGLSLLGASCFLLITIVVYVMLWERQNVHGWTSLSYFTSLFGMFLLTGIDEFGYVFFYNGGRAGPHWACYSLAVGSHFFWLSAFCWMSAVNFDLWWTFRALLPTASKSKGLKQFLIYTVVCVGIPTVIVGVAIGLDIIYKDDLESNVITPQYGVRRCFLENQWAIIPYLYGPISVLMMCNLGFFVVTVFDMYKIQQSTKFAAVSSSSKNSRQNQSAFLFFKLFLLMGIPWSFDVISWATSKCGQNPWYWKIFDMINIFQAVAIFITFVCKSETKKALTSKYPVLQRVFLALAIQPDRAQQILDKRPGLRFLIQPFTRRRKSRGTYSSGKTHSTSLDLSRRPSRNAGLDL